MDFLLEKDNDHSLDTDAVNYICYQLKTMMNYEGRADSCLWDLQWPIWLRADSTLAPSQWETSLQSNAVSHWLGVNLESALRLQTKNQPSSEHKELWISLDFPVGNFQCLKNGGHELFGENNYSWNYRIFIMNISLVQQNSIGHVTLVAITGTIILVHYLRLKIGH